MPYFFVDHRKKLTDLRTEEFTVTSFSFLVENHLKEPDCISVPILDLNSNDLSFGM